MFKAGYPIGWLRPEQHGRQADLGRHFGAFGPINAKGEITTGRTT
jgi:hypothetical protein